jgi:plastocyanin
MRRSWPAISFVAVAATVAAGCGGSSDSSATDTSTAADTTTTASGSASGTLSGSVGPGYDISMDKTTVAPGTYTLNVDDQGTIHDFHLTGPGGVDVSTGISETGKKMFTVTLQKGTYTFVCDPHASQMHGTLTVG